MREAVMTFIIRGVSKVMTVRCDVRELSGRLLAERTRAMHHRSFGRCQALPFSSCWRAS
ncbi:MAG: hypothetical protein AW07_00029 [Candidatus Accumulibacter sp. SK-11]|nr:MAG: hypothetical protein AW07_00029 [Candidatus Accumulibacter sp. SK-11]